MLNKVYQKLDPVTGPIPREEFKKLVDAPYGEALRRIRKHDPLYGRPPGEKFKWACTFTREVTEEGVGYVMAESEEEAEEMAGKLKESDLHWDVSDRYGSMVLDSVDPE